FDFSPQSGERIRLAHARGSESGGRSDGAKIKLRDVVRFARLDFKNEAGELIGVAFLDDANEFRGIGLFDALYVEAPGLRPKGHFAINVTCVRRIVFLEEVEKCGAVAAIEGLEPGGKLPRSWRVRGLVAGLRSIAVIALQGFAQVPGRGGLASA